MSSRKVLTHNKKVISLEAAEPRDWKFWDFRQNGEDVIDTWLATLSDRAQEMFNALLKNNRKVANPIDWLGLKPLKGGDPQKERIWELRFSADNFQYRVLGYFGPGKREATLLLGCYHKQRVYKPPNALTTAV